MSRKRIKYGLRDFVEANSENRKYYDLFFDYIKKVYKPKTVKIFESHLKHFICWNTVSGGNKVFYKMDKEDYLEYQLSLIKQDYSHSTVDMRRRTIEKFFEWYIGRYKHISPFVVNIAKDSKATLVKNSYRTGILTADEMAKIGRHSIKTGNIMDWIVLILVVDYGMTLKEVAQLKRSSIVHEYYESEKYILNQVDTEDGVRQYIVNEKLMDLLRAYDESRGYDEFDTMFVFKKSSGTIPVTKENIRSVLNHYTYILNRSVCGRDLTNTHTYFHAMRDINRRKKLERKRKSR